MDYVRQYKNPINQNQNNKVRKIISLTRINTFCFTNLLCYVNPSQLPLGCIRIRTGNRVGFGSPKALQPAGNIGATET